MFRIMFKSKTDKKETEIPVLDRIYSDFNQFTIDSENNKLKVHLEANYKNGYNFHDMLVCEKEGWDWKHLEYTINEHGYLEMDIPNGYEVVVRLR